MPRGRRPQFARPSRVAASGDKEDSRMRYWLLIGVGLGMAASNRAAIAQSAPWKPIDSTPAARLGEPAPAATLGIPRAQDALASNGPLFRAAAPDPLVGDYSPAAKLGPISDV